MQHSTRSIYWVPPPLPRSVSVFIAPNLFRPTNSHQKFSKIHGTCKVLLSSRFEMASPARVAHCQLRPQAPTVRSKEQLVPVQIPVPKPKLAEPEATNIVLQPRLCNLRSYGSDRSGSLIRTRKDGVDGGADDVSPFFATLSEYIESSQRSHDFEIISGRLAMMVFAGTVTMEIVTGNSVFRKMEVEGIVEAGGVCLGAIAFAAMFAWFSSARNRVSKMFTIGCNTFIDSVIDQIVDSLFYESEPSDWSDEL